MFFFFLEEQAFKKKPVGPLISAVRQWSRQIFWCLSFDHQKHCNGFFMAGRFCAFIYLFSCEEQVWNILRYLFCLSLWIKVTQIFFSFFSPLLHIWSKIICWNDFGVPGSPFAELFIWSDLDMQASCSSLCPHLPLRRHPPTNKKGTNIWFKVEKKSQCGSLKTFWNKNERRQRRTSNSNMTRFLTSYFNSVILWPSVGNGSTWWYVYQYYTRETV